MSLQVFLFLPALCVIFFLDRRHASTIRERNYKRWNNCINIFSHLKLSGIHRWLYTQMKQFQVQMWLETPDLSTRNWKVYPFHHSMNCLCCSRFHCFPLPQPTKSSRRPTQSLAKSFRKHVAVFPSTVQSRTDKKRNKWANKRFRGQIQRTVLNEHKSRLLSQPIEHTIL